MDEVEKLTDREQLVLITMLEDQLDTAAGRHDDESVKELASIIRKLGGGQ